jgi:hypothetical protein
MNISGVCCKGLAAQDEGSKGTLLSPRVKLLFLEDASLSGEGKVSHRTLCCAVHKKGGRRRRKRREKGKKKDDQTQTFFFLPGNQKPDKGREDLLVKVNKCPLSSPDQSPARPTEMTRKFVLVTRAKGAYILDYEWQ